MAIWGKKSGVTTGNRMGMRKLYTEYRASSRNEQWKAPERQGAFAWNRELTQSLAAEAPAKGSTEILVWPRKVFKSPSVKQD